GCVLPADVDDVTQVLDDRADAVAAEITRAEDDADDSAPVGDGAELLVIHVAPVLEDAEHARVADDGWISRQGARVQRTARVDVGQIHDDPEMGGGRHDIAAEGGESVGVSPAAAVRGIAELVGAEVAEAEVADAAPREVIELVEAAFERVAALDAEEAGD